MQDEDEESEMDFSAESLGDYLFDLCSIPSAVDHARAVELCSFLRDFDVVSMLLQTDGQKAMDLDDVRVQFDMLIEKYPGTAYHLSADAAIVQNESFEKGVVKLQPYYIHTTYYILLLH